MYGGQKWNQNIFFKWEEVMIALVLEARDRKRENETEKEKEKEKERRKKEETERKINDWRQKNFRLIFLSTYVCISDLVAKGDTKGEF